MLALKYGLFCCYKQLLLLMSVWMFICCEDFSIHISPISIIPSTLFVLPFCSHTFMYRASWILLLCVYLSVLLAALKPLIVLCTARSRRGLSFARESRQYQGYKWTSASPRHCTNIILIESFTPKPPLACEILSQVATQDLAEGNKA